ncbi:MAG: hypothetical protein COZ49_03835 [Candidatus Yonathbacteria bacterium CG_4_10_14_3_um_filter_47_65]|uniref:Uncharacterized protein n=2 Tax=Parcubacteria group TaxID=1794811 RepID=A0A2M8D7H7_9BACT|nr:MAG: hypothetical protein AUJ44_04540 [Candidatus Nomurabacteria bacterium CG1_02_47_685]PIP03513.1 MAG: hypothetical protein COX54_03390 [Candidatus Yonathbacteria bacterium CG23_combo_of_CG06-09_8_20_14_all_46_18]PIQ33269.1 MAG: hypothetical protein COW61_00020 [Candidatus Yonathbacteria bacterium CG17_big_fil_post_rev_8_21_14_2_50_46_19]PIX56106.1 MAG: hypothetical protein COZ49_03835 [Candidatus Yonathbacteria bacterium CG_4_10_14_3_um_filter_47_65]PIY57542.1 MAG: hypothetical protein CO
MINRKKTIVILFVAVLLGIVLGGIYWLVFRVVEQKTAESLQAESDVEGYLNTEGGMAVLQKKVKESRNLRDELNTHFVKGDNIVAFMEEIESLGSLANVSIKLDNVEAFSEEYVLDFDFTSKGSFGGNMKLISLIDALPYKTNVQKVYLRNVGVPISTSGTDALPEWEGRFSVEIIGYLDR